MAMYQYISLLPYKYSKLLHLDVARARDISWPFGLSCSDEFSTGREKLVTEDRGFKFFSKLRMYVIGQIRVLILHLSSIISRVFKVELFEFTLDAGYSIGRRGRPFNVDDFCLATFSGTGVTVAHIRMISKATTLCCRQRSRDDGILTPLH
jgi:hypothetical protein